MKKQLNKCTFAHLHTSIAQWAIWPKHMLAKDLSSSFGDFDPQTLLPNGPDILPHLSSDQQVSSQPEAWPN